MGINNAGRQGDHGQKSGPPGKEKSADYAGQSEYRADQNGLLEIHELRMLERVKLSFSRLIGIDQGVVGVIVDKHLREKERVAKGEQESF